MGIGAVGIKTYQNSCVLEYLKENIEALVRGWLTTGDYNTVNPSKILLYLANYGIDRNGFQFIRRLNQMRGMTIRTPKVARWQKDYRDNLSFPFDKAIFYKSFYWYNHAIP